MTWLGDVNKKRSDAQWKFFRMMKPADADELLLFTEMMLKPVYEFPKRLPAPTASPNP